MDKDEFRRVNQILGASPMFGPFPAELLVPWAIISFTAFIFANNIFGLHWFTTVLIIAWGNVTWWVLTGSKPHRFLSKFLPVPRWTRGLYRYSGLRKPIKNKYVKKT